MAKTAKLDQHFHKKRENRDNIFSTEKIAKTAIITYTGILEQSALLPDKGLHYNNKTAKLAITGYSKPQFSKKKMEKTANHRHLGQHFHINRTECFEKTPILYYYLDKILHKNWKTARAA